MNTQKALDALINPSKVLKHLWRRTKLGNFELREQFDAFYKPQYAWGMVQAAKIAKTFGINRITAIEFGVAAGGGLLSLDKYSLEIMRDLGVQIDCYGFDSGKGLTKPVDFRDAPYIWKEGQFSPSDGDMYNFNSLRSKLLNSQLVIGDVKETVPEFSGKLTSPIGFISFDLDLYTSTRDAFEIFNGDHSKYLPRVPLYFDDVSGPDAFCNEFMGELLAIEEFNAKTAGEKIAKINGFELYRKIPSSWNVGAYMYHRFDHGNYNDFTDYK